MPKIITLSEFVFNDPLANIGAPGIRGEFVWSDQYSTNIAHYPPECLPSTNTVYYSSFGFSPSTQPYLDPLASTAGSVTGSLLTLGIFPFGLPVGSAQNWTTNHRHIFAQVDYRINEPFVVTSDNIEEIQSQSLRLGQITLPEHIFEGLAVTQEPIDVPPRIAPITNYTLNIYNLKTDYSFTVQFSLVFETDVNWSVTGITTEYMGTTDNLVSIDRNGLLTIKPVAFGSGKTTVTVQAKNSMGESSKTIEFIIVNNTTDNSVVQSLPDEEIPSKERLEDILWRGLSEKRGQISDNLFRNVVVNRLSIYYRMDNGTDKATDIAGQSGLGASYQASSNDGSSKIMEITYSDDIKEGDTLYVTYAAAKEHYLRQVVHIKWTAIDAGFLGFVSLPTSVYAANYRWYKWKTRGKLGELPGTEGTTELEGWRIVESFQYNPELVGNIFLYINNIVRFIQNNKTDNKISYIPVSADINDIYDSINNPQSLVFEEESFTRNGSSNNHNYQLVLTAFDDMPLDEKEQSWYGKYLADNPNVDYNDFIEHSVYNVHPVALSARDVDKKGYWFRFANSIDEAIKAGEETYIPFLDARGWPADDPFFGSISENLAADNFKIDPIRSTPQIINKSNALSISSPIGLFPRVGSGWIYAEFVSNIIREQFKKGTRILVETKPLGQRGTVVLSVNCAGGGEGFVYAVQDKNYRNVYVYSNNSDGFLISRIVRYDYFHRDLDQLNYRPLLGGINYENVSINTKGSTRPVIGLAGLAGDSPGAFPGRVVSFYKYAQNDAFIEYYSNEQKTQIQSSKQVSGSLQGSSITIPLGGFIYTGSLSLSIKYKIKGTLPSGSPTRYQGIISNAFDEINTGGEGTFIFTSGNSVESVIDKAPIESSTLPEIKVVTVDEGTNNEYNRFSIEANQAITMRNYYWLKGDSIRIQLPLDPDDLVNEIENKIDDISITSTEIEPSEISIIGIKSSYAVDFSEREGSVNFLTPALPNWTGGNFVKTDYAVSHLDEMGIVYVAFDDQSGNISCIVTNDEGYSWTLQYAIIPSIDDIPNMYVYLSKASSLEQMFLFFVRNAVLYVGVLPMNEMLLSDAFKVKIDEDNDDFIGQIRNTAVYVAAGNVDSDTLDFISSHERYRMGRGTVFSCVPFETAYFSAYQNNRGQLKLFFLDDNHKVQCYFSPDNGVSWNDMLVCMKEGVEGIDKQFDDFGTTAKGYKYGINPHPTNLETEAKIDAPCAIYNPITNRVCLFYVYKNCLLCKTLDDPEADCLGIEGNAYDNLVNSMETERSMFVDGDATQIADEIDINIIMTNAYAIGSFDQSRNILAQRIHAIWLENGSMKVFYKTDDGAIRSAWQNGYEWIVEDMMHPVEEVDLNV